MEADVVLSEQVMDFHAGLIAQHLSYFGFGEALGAVAFDGEGLERGAGGILAGGDELLSECVRDGEGHLHGLRIAF